MRKGQAFLLGVERACREKGEEMEITSGPKNNKLKLERWFGASRAPCNRKRGRAGARAVMGKRTTDLDERKDPNEKSLFAAQHRTTYD